MNNLNDLMEKVKNADGYMFALSTVTNGIVENTLVTEKYQKLDMLPSLKKIKELIIAELEKEEIVEPITPIE